MLTDIHTLETKFSQEYNGLNILQQQVIDAQGPVWLNAFPFISTSNLQALRVCKILLENPSSGEHIFCITSESSFADVLKTRVETLIGPNTGGVHFYSIESFCRKIIEDNARFFNHGDILPITTVERIQLLKSLINRFAKKHPLKKFRSDVYNDIPKLTELFSAMKKEGITVENLQQQIVAYMALRVPDTTTLLSTQTTEETRLMRQLYTAGQTH